MTQFATVVLLLLVPMACCSGHREFWETSPSPNSWGRPPTESAFWGRLHHNEIIFQHVDDSQKLHMNWKGYGRSITEGEPFKGSVFKETDRGGAIDVLAGRSSTEHLVYRFLDGINDNNIIGSSNDQPTPEYLNFIIVGTIQFEWRGRIMTCDGIKIAQGHEWFFWNPWWIGAPYCKRPEREQRVPDGYMDGPLFCNCDVGRLALYTTETSNTFGVNLEFHTFIERQPLDYAQAGSGFRPEREYFSQGRPYDRFQGEVPQERMGPTKPNEAQYDYRSHAYDHFSAVAQGQAHAPYSDRYRQEFLQDSQSRHHYGTPDQQQEAHAHRYDEGRAGSNELYETQSGNYSDSDRQDSLLESQSQHYLARADLHQEARAYSYDKDRARTKNLYETQSANYSVRDRQDFLHEPQSQHYPGRTHQHQDAHAHDYGKGRARLNEPYEAQSVNYSDRDTHEFLQESQPQHYHGRTEQQREAHANGYDRGRARAQNPYETQSVDYSDRYRQDVLQESQSHFYRRRAGQHQDAQAHGSGKNRARLNEPYGAQSVSYSDRDRHGFLQESQSQLYSGRTDQQQDTHAHGYGKGRVRPNEAHEAHTANYSDRDRHELLHESQSDYSLARTDLHQDADRARTKNPYAKQSANYSNRYMQHVLQESQSQHFPERADQHQDAQAHGSGKGRARINEQYRAQSTTSSDRDRHELLQESQPQHYHGRARQQQEAHAYGSDKSRARSKELYKARSANYFDSDGVASDLPNETQHPDRQSDHARSKSGSLLERQNSDKRYPHDRSGSNYIADAAFCGHFTSAGISGVLSLSFAMWLALVKRSNQPRFADASARLVSIEAP